MEKFRDFYEKKTNENIAFSLVEAGFDVDKICEDILCFAKNNKLDEGFWGGMGGVVSGVKQSWQAGSKKQNLDNVSQKIQNLKQELVKLNFPPEYLEKKFADILSGIESSKNHIDQYGDYKKFNYASPMKRATALPDSQRVRALPPPIPKRNAPVYQGLRRAEPLPTM